MGETLGQSVLMAVWCRRRQLVVSARRGRAEAEEDDWQPLVKGRASLWGKDTVESGASPVDPIKDGFVYTQPRQAGAVPPVTPPAVASPLPWVATGSGVLLAAYLLLRGARGWATQRWKATLTGTHSPDVRPHTPPFGMHSKNDAAPSVVEVSTESSGCLVAAAVRRSWADGEQPQVSHGWLCGWHDHGPCGCGEAGPDGCAGRRPGQGGAPPWSPPGWCPSSFLSSEQRVTCRELIRATAGRQMLGGVRFDVCVDAQPLRLAMGVRAAGCRTGCSRRRRW